MEMLKIMKKIIDKLQSSWNKLLYKLMFKNYMEKPKVSKKRKGRK